MRSVIAIVSVLILLGWLAYEIDQPAGDLVDRSVATQWRRTADGWEKVSTFDWKKSTGAIATTGGEPHPVVLSLLVAFISIFVLVAFSPARRSLQRRRPHPARKLGEVRLFCRLLLEPSHFA